MGLDMYLSRHTHVKNWDHMADKEKVKITVTENKRTEGIKPERISYIIEEVGYWRKANAIHRWFVTNCQDGKDECQDTYVSEDQLKELKTVCLKVLNDNNLAESLLPPQAGFFYGDTEINEWYFNDLRDTVKIINEALADTGYAELYYQSSW